MLVSIVKLKPTLHGMTIIFRDEKQLRDMYVFLSDFEKH